MRGFRKTYGRGGACNGTIVLKCYIAALIKIPFEFTRFSKLQIVVKIEFILIHTRGELLPLGAYKWGGLLSLGAFDRMYVFLLFTGKWAYNWRGRGGGLMVLCSR